MCGPTLAAVQKQAGLSDRVQARTRTATLMDYASISLLLLAIIGALISSTGVNTGWATGHVEPKPKWGPITPGMAIDVQLGW